MFEKLTIIGHRGAAGLEPENTIPSFLRALELGCRVLELDVRALTRDPGSLAVIHDARLDRTTNLSGNVYEFSEGDLKQAVPPVPMLSDVISALLSWCHKHRVQPRLLTLNIELKGKATAEATQLLVQSFPQLSYLVSSFDHDELSDFRQLDSVTPVAPLFDKWQKNCVDIAKALNASGINLSKWIVTKQRVRAIHDSGYKVWVYTVNTRRSAIRLAKLGVDGIFTDRPDRMLN